MIHTTKVTLPCLPQAHGDRRNLSKDGQGKTSFSNYFSIKILPLLTLLFLSYNVVVSQNPREIDISGFYFNKEAIAAGKIKTIVAEIATKTNLTRITPKGIAYHFEFGSSGLLLRELKIITKDAKVDTFITTYIYNNDQVTIKRIKNLDNYFTNYYEYDSAGNCIKETYCKETNIADEPHFFKLGRQEVIWSESYTYTPISKSQLKKKSFNDDGRIFSETIIYTNEKKLKTEEDCRYTVTRVNVNNQYFYDAQKRLVKKRYYSNASGKLEEITEYTYDDSGKVTEEKFHRNGQLVFTKFLFYDSSNNRLVSELKKFPTNKEFEIIEPVYEFY